MATKYIGYDQILDTKTKGQPEGKISVKLRRQGQKPRWVQMSIKEYETRAVIRNT